MKMFDSLRKRSSRAHAKDAVPGEGTAGSHGFPIENYDALGHKEIGARLHRLSQVELAAVETHERAHQSRPEVLAKLRYMRSPEPVPGYDALDSPQVAELLAGADAATVKAVRDYERRFAQRPAVLDEATRVLPGAPASASEERAHEERTARVRAGFASRDESASDLADRREEPGL